MTPEVKAYVESLGLKVEEYDYGFYKITNKDGVRLHPDLATFFYNAHKESVRKVLEAVKERLPKQRDGADNLTIPYQTASQRARLLADGLAGGFNNCRDEVHQAIDSMIKELA